MKSVPLDVSWAVTRRKLQDAMQHVWRHAGDTAGSDRRSRADTFGAGPRSKEFRATFEHILRNRRRYQFSQARITTLRAPEHRSVAIIPFRDRVVQYCIVLAIRDQCPPKRTNVARTGLDGRWSVAWLAMLLSGRDARFVIKSDFSKAFDSLVWPAVLKATPRLSAQALEVVRAMCEFYSPTGIGLPAGLNISHAILDLACDGLDQRLEVLGLGGARYVDDLVVVGTADNIGAELSVVIREEVAQFGLKQHPEKTRLHDFSPLPNLGGCRTNYVDHLGFRVAAGGKMDVDAETANNLAKAKGTTRSQMARCYSLAHRGENYRKALGIPQICRGPSLFGLVRGNSLGSSPDTTGINEPHPNPAPAGTLGSQLPPLNNPGGGGRRGRGGLSRPLRPKRKNLDSQVLVWGGYLPILRAAESWDGRCHPDLERISAQVLFGETPERVRQYARALEYWRVWKELARGNGVVFHEAMEESIVRDVWPVLMAAATVTQPQAIWVCEQDPVEQVFLFYGGAPNRKCVEAIQAERRARSAGMRPTQLSLWGKATTGFVASQVAR